MTLSNGQLSELLGLQSEREEAPHRRRALHRASRAALFWEEEAAVLVAEGRSPTELPGVGPWVERFVLEWLGDPPSEMPEPPAMRRGFLTMAEVRSTPGVDEWRRAVRADLQMHTTYSDGKVPLEGMVEAAAARGHSFVAITDHSVGLPIANGMSEERLAAQAEHIARLNGDLGGDIRVLHSIEMNLSPEGEGDMDPLVLARLDLVLGAFHSKLRLTEDQTDRYLAAVRNPTVHVLAHPRTRMFNRRKGLDADWPRVFAEAAALDKAVEIDANPHRQDLDVVRLEQARDAGVRISIGTDAHSIGELDFLDFGLASAIRAGIDRDRILNFMPVQGVLDWARATRERAPPA
ncbi:MAG: PHP domain-containing protein [Actinomycetota bacterium]